MRKQQWRMLSAGGARPDAAVRCTHWARPCGCLSCALITSTVKIAGAASAGRCPGSKLWEGGWQWCAQSPGWSMSCTLAESPLIISAQGMAASEPASAPTGHAYAALANCVKSSANTRLPASQRLKQRANAMGRTIQDSVRVKQPTRLRKSFGFLSSGAARAHW